MGETKVAKLYNRIFASLDFTFVGSIQQYILNLHVAVNNPLLVNMLESSQDVRAIWLKFFLIHNRTQPLLCLLRKHKPYLLYFLLKVSSIVAVLEQEDELVMWLGVVVELHHILVLELAMNDALLLCVAVLRFADKLILHYALLYNSLYLGEVSTHSEGCKYFQIFKLAISNFSLRFIPLSRYSRCI